jgi:hypothetical protein
MPILEKINSLPEGKELVSKVLEQGPLRIKRDPRNSNQFEGYWSAWDRTIYITEESYSSECSLITTLLFELHNALSTDELEKYYSLASNNQISRNRFIQSIELIEYENALSTAEMLRHGEECGIFPKNCDWYIADTFSEHYHFQKAYGHSASIGQIYDNLRL